jgi:hypothetical protein
MSTTIDDISADLSGAFIKKQDLENGPLSLVIIAADKTLFEAKNGRPAEEKWVLSFEGDPIRKRTMNKTNLAWMAKYHGRKPSAWLGQRIELFWDENVSFAGQLVGGIRFRVPSLPF